MEQVGLTKGSIPASHCMLAWGSSCLHGATSTVELQLANSYTHTHIRPNKSAKSHICSKRNLFPLMFTTFWSSGAQSSLSSPCSALAHVVFFMSNLILNLKPATTYKGDMRGKMCSYRLKFLPPSPPVPLPVWWRSRQCAGQTGEWSQTWSCTW